MVLMNYAKNKVGQSIKRPQNGSDVRGVATSGIEQSNADGAVE